jgi:ubiquinone/menaquinone biosynthesis C-methylase UbiE
MLLFAKKKLRTAHLVQADALALPVRRNSAEIVQCIGLAEYCKDISTLLQALSDCLSENGFLIISSAPRTLFSSVRNALGNRIYRHSPDTINAGIARTRLALKKQVQSNTQILYLLKKEVDSN